LKKSKLH